MIGPEFHGGGHPWHGLCQGGSVALPNATAKTYPQPSGGDCFGLVVPGFVAPFRTVAQESDDTAQGFQWLDYVLMSGDSSTPSGLQVYGKPLGKMKWLWAVSIAEKWLVDASGLVVSGGNLTGNLVLTEFGLQRPNGAAAETKTLAVNVAADCDAAVKIKILDLSPFGDGALIGLYAYADGTHTNMSMKPVPLAVHSITLAPYVASVSKVYGMTEYESQNRIVWPLTVFNGQQLSVTATPIGAYLDVLGARKVWIGARRNTTPPIDVYSRPGWTVQDSRFMLLKDRAGDAYLQDAGYFDVRVEWQGYLTNPPPPNAVDYIAPTVAQIAPINETYTPYNYAVSEIIDLANARLADVQASYIPWDPGVPFKDAGGNFHFDQLLTQVDWVYPSDEALAATQDGNYPFWRLSNFVSEMFEEQKTEPDSGDVFKRAYTKVSANSDQYLVYYQGGVPQYYTTVNVGGTTTFYVSPYANYLRRTTLSTTSAQDFHFWIGQSDYGEYLHCPWLYVAGTSTWSYIYSYTAEYKLLLDGATIPLGSETKLITLGYDVGFVPRSDMINRLQKGNADRIEFYITGRIDSPEMDRNAAYAEAFFVNPCAGVYGLAFRKILVADATPNLLYKLTLKGNTDQVWAGWLAHGPHDYKMTWDPIQGVLASTAPTQPDLQQPVVPAAAICFV